MAASLIRTVVLSSNIIMSREYCRRTSGLGWYGARFRDLVEELYQHPFFYLEHDPIEVMNGYEKDLLMQKIRLELNEGNYFRKALELRGNRKLMVSCLEELSLSLPVSFSGDLLLPSREKGTSLGEIYHLYQEKSVPGYSLILDQVLDKVRSGDYDKILASYHLILLDDLPLMGRERELFNELINRVGVEKVELLTEKDFDKVTCQAAQSVRGNLNRLFQWMADEELEGKDCRIVALDYDAVSEELYFRCNDMSIYLHGGILCRFFSFYDQYMTLLQEQYARSGNNSQFIKTVKVYLAAQKGKYSVEPLEKLFYGKILACLMDLGDFLKKLASEQEEEHPDALLLLRGEVESLRFTPGELKLERGGLELYSLDQAYALPSENLAVLNLNHKNYPGHLRLDPLLKKEERQAVNEVHKGCLGEEDFRVENQVQILLRGCMGFRFLSYESHSKDTGKLEVPSSLFSEILKARGEEIKVDNVYEMCHVPSDYLQDLDNQGVYLNLPVRLELKNHLMDERERGYNDNFREKMSASSLETYYSCPYKFYLKYLEKLKPPEWGEDDLTQWLDPMVRGSLLHRAYELLLLPFIEQETKSHANYRFYLKNLSDDQIDMIWNDALDSYTDKDEKTRYREFRPEVALYIREQELDEIRASLGRFLEHEFNREEDFYPVALEKEFDFHCNVGNSSLQFSGYIDRVETDGKGHYRVWDYKTGKNYFKDSQAYLFHIPVKDKPDKLYFQHALYSRALKESKDFSNVESVTGAYYFCTDRGGWSRVVHSGGNEIERFQRILEGYEKQAGSGIYCRNRKSCDWCDYRFLCIGQEKLNNFIPSEQLEDLYKRVVEDDC